MAINLTSKVRVHKDLVIGSGSFGWVYIGNLDDIPVAVKCSKQPEHRRHTREIEHWTKLNHPNFVPFYGYLQNDASLPKDIVTPHDTVSTYNVVTPAARNLWTGAPTRSCSLSSPAHVRTEARPVAHFR
ncbi:hypothetical protein PUNSTDRAFT_122087 [Punctularia strigosozonata HHB-11173 SS5]|uniref:uncharacterized protein n=1 Tax=Punctularia strigosozonata (strain HHB-11173) TaxID=741275 RepID=UPI000441806D|nr:uncharacterized protein PUNSTDRAFT_122087 [Punctularia strigosozonata HHB-11173 SS5]EIN06249.1 hypothetical protein PUNSTDRAFT_122087 [Punctularia strigosozonata HHB-11173 SS5]